MSRLYERMAVACARLVSKTEPDGEGGFKTVLAVGDGFMAAIVRDSSTASRSAEHDGVRNVYTEPPAAPLRYGLAVPDENGGVRCFIEKPGWARVVSALVSTGIYVVSPRAMDYVPEGEMFVFAADLYPRLLQNREKIHGALPKGYWCDVGTPRSYYQCCIDALDGRLRLSEGTPEAGSAPEAAQARR